jgi:hypothetical protein
MSKEYFKKNLTAYLMLIVIILFTLAIVFKSWLILIPAVLIHLAITIKESKTKGFIMTFLIYLFVEIVFGFAIIGIINLVKLIF